MAMSCEEIREKIMSAINTGDSYDMGVRKTYPDYAILYDYNSSKYYKVTYKLEKDDVFSKD